MNEHILEINASAIFPHPLPHTDPCWQRVQHALGRQRGVLRAHWHHDRHPVRLCLHYDPQQITPEAAQRLAVQAGRSVTRRYRHLSFTLDTLTPNPEALTATTGILSVQFDPALDQGWVKYDAHQITRRQVQRRLRQLGYRPPGPNLHRWIATQRPLLLSLMAGILWFSGWIGLRLDLIGLTWARWLFLGAYGLGGFDIARHTWHHLRQREWDTDLLMLLAAAGAAAVGDWAEGALLIFLFSLGHALEERTLDRARSAIRSLAQLTPKTALVRREGQWVTVPVAQVRPGEVVMVRPGERFPVDGEVVAGYSAVNQAPITGESIPVEKGPGDPVFAGTVNGHGALEIRATRAAQESTLARIAQLVAEARTHRSPTQRLTERFTRHFVQLVLLADLILLLAPPLLWGVPWSSAFSRAMTLLVAASPCALALGTPAAVLAGIAQAARHGILVKGGAPLELLGRIRAVAFDKTGTLTWGTPEVVQVHPLAPGWTPAEVLRLAAAAEKASTHPLAQAVVRAAQAQNIPLADPHQARTLPGQGIQARVLDRQVLVGSVSLLQEHGITLPGDAQQRLKSEEDQGHTTMWVVVDQALIGLIAVADRPRPEAPQVLTTLKRLGVETTVMLTGDRPRVAAAVAAQVGVDTFRANLLPEDKQRAVQDLVAHFGAVAMVGDGINDAPALAAATVGIAMGSAGSDVALETADVALMSDHLRQLTFALGLGRATRAIVRQNLALAIGTIIGLSLAALTGYTTMGLAVFLHEGVTLLVALNALRLLRYTPT